jgi:hypothetical protein
MKQAAAVSCVAALALLSGACGDSSPSQPTTPVVVATPTPAPTPVPLGNPPVSATVGVFGYVRREGNNQGRFPVPPPPPFYQIGDAIDIGCTPRDAAGRETRNHPDFVEWHSSSGGEGVLILDYDYVWNEGNRYADQIEIRFLARSGFIDVSCKIPGTNIVSQTIRLNVFGGIR